MRACLPEALARKLAVIQGTLYVQVKGKSAAGNLPWTLDVPNTVQQWWNICLVLQTPSATCFRVGISLECYSSFPSS